jgi:hypothetical protein
VFKVRFWLIYMNAVDIQDTALHRPGN